MLFADSIFKGETARRALEEIRLLKYRVTRVIAAPDLRMDRREKQLGDVPFAALVSPDEFVAEVVENPDEAAKIPLVEGLDCAANPFR